MIKRLHTLLALAMALTCLRASADARLSGRVIGSQYSYDYATSSQSTTVNTKNNVFDGNFDTYFASYDRSGSWVGLDLRGKYVITKVGWGCRTGYEQRVMTAVIEGANKEDFSDAVPIYMIQQYGVNGTMQYAAVNCSRGFRYVRYCSPNDMRCTLAELEFYGVKGDGDDSQFYQVTNLPLVVVNTKDDAEIVSKDESLNCYIHVISDGGKKMLTDTIGEVKGRGNASWQYAKKPYRIKFSSKQRVLDAPAKAKKWTLLANYGDGTLLRNRVAFEIARRFEQPYVPFNTNVDLIVNGEYRGNYNLCDQIEVNKNRVNVTEMDSTCTTGSALTGGYLIEVDAYAYSEESMFTSAQGIPVTIKSPDSDEITPEQYNYIKGRFNAMESAAYASYFTHETRGYQNYLNRDSFLKHILVNETAGNTDVLWSMYMYKQRDDAQFMCGPQWDFDIAFDNDNRLYPTDQWDDFIYCSDGSSQSRAGTVVGFANRIIKSDASTAPRMKEIWTAAREKQNLTSESLIAFLDSLAADIEQSRKLNFFRWKTQGDTWDGNALTNYQTQMDIVKNFLQKRIPRIDGFLNYTSGIEIADGDVTMGYIDASEGEVVLRGFAAGMHYEIFNLQGALVEAGSADGDVRIAMPQGIYVVRVSQPATVVTRKILVK